jgi:hypothetical protein
LTGDLHPLLAEVDLHLLTRRGLEADRGEGLGSRLLAERDDRSLQSSQLDVNSSIGQLLLNDDGVSLGNGAKEIVHFTERVVIETTRRRTLLKTGPGSSEITADGVAGDPQLSSNPFAPETLAGQLVDPIHDFRSQHPVVLLRGSQVDTGYVRLVRLHVLQNDQTGV